MNNIVRRRFGLVVFVVLSLLFTLPATLLAGGEFYVSPKGKDTNSGTKFRPFATLARARDAIRVLKSKDGLPKDGATVYLRAGEYNLSETFTLTPQDSGTTDAPITYTAYNDEDACIVSKRAVTGWSLLAAPWPAGLPAAAQSKVFVADISKAWRFHFLYVNNISQPVARSTRSDEWYKAWKRIASCGPPAPAGRSITFPAGQLADIPSNGDAEISMTTAWWWNIVAPITAVDSVARTALLQSKCTVEYHNLLAFEGGYYNLRNALPVLDEPGEWVVDSSAGRVYYWPPDGTMKDKTAFAPVLHELIRFQGDEEGQRWARQVEYVNMTGLRFLYTDRTPESEYDSKWLTRNAENPDAMIYLQGVKHCMFDNNVIAFSGSQGFALDHYAQNITLTRNEIAFSSSGGIQITGYGPGDVDVNKNHLIERNFIHDMGLDYMHSGAISIYGSNGNTIRCNYMTDCPYACVSIVGMPARHMSDPNSIDTMDAYGSKQALYQARWEELNRHKPLDTMSMRPYLHSGENLVVSNVCDNYMQKLEDGGALYTWEGGLKNVWICNVGERHNLRERSSSSMHLDDDTAMNTFSNNTFWSPGLQINNNSHNNSNILKDNEISPDKPARYDAARKAIFDYVIEKGIWRSTTRRNS